jgi:hypothetical protein
MTIGEARAELGAALASGGVPIGTGPGAVAPPSGLVYGEGITADSQITRGQVEARFRVVLLAGAWDHGATADKLDALKLAAMTVTRELTGWRFDELRPDRLTSIGGGQLLAADLIATRMVDI